MYSALMQADPHHAVDLFISIFKRKAAKAMTTVDNRRKARDNTCTQRVATDGKVKTPQRVPSGGSNERRPMKPSLRDSNLPNLVPVPADDDSSIAIDYSDDYKVTYKNGHPDHNKNENIVPFAGRQQPTEMEVTQYEGDVPAYRTRSQTPRRTWCYYA